MKKLFIVLLIITTNSLYSQEIIPVKTKKWDLKTYPEYVKENSKEEGVWIYNISEPKMLIYKAKGENTTDKTMIVCPGGGLVFSAFEKEGTRVAEKLSENGITAVVLKYRLTPHSNVSIPGKEKIILKYASDDALYAIAHLRKNSKKYGINPDKIGLMGFSAGGAVTMETAYRAEKKNLPNFIAPIYPWMIVVEDQEVPDYKPPAFIVCANDDNLKLAPASVKIYSDWIKAGAEADLHMFQKGGHGFGMAKKNSPIDSWSDLLVDWILSL